MSLTSDTNTPEDSAAEAHYAEYYKDCFELCWDPKDRELCKGYVIEVFKDAYALGLEAGRKNLREQVEAAFKFAWRAALQRALWMATYKGIRSALPETEEPPPCDFYKYSDSHG